MEFLLKMMKITNGQFDLNKGFLMCLSSCIRNFIDNNKHLEKVKVSKYFPLKQTALNLHFHFIRNFFTHHTRDFDVIIAGT